MSIFEADALGIKASVCRRNLKVLESHVTAILYVLVGIDENFVSSGSHQANESETLKCRKHSNVTNLHIAQTIKICTA